MTTTYGTASSPIGRILLVARGGALAGVYFEDHARGPAIAGDWTRDEARFDDARRQLAEYFAGARASFDLPLDAEGTPFQRGVWDALRAIPFGATIPYAELARRVGRVGAARAVGHANARNPLSIVVPCHRVVGSDGALTGYAGGEARKRWLLDHERRVNTRRVSPGSSSCWTSGPGSNTDSSIGGNFTASGSVT